MSDEIVDPNDDADRIYMFIENENNEFPNRILFFHKPADRSEIHVEYFTPNNNRWALHGVHIHDKQIELLKRPGYIINANYIDLQSLFRILCRRSGLQLALDSREYTNVRDYALDKTLELFNVRINAFDEQIKEEDDTVIFDKYFYLYCNAYTLNVNVEKDTEWILDNSRKQQRGFTIARVFNRSDYDYMTSRFQFLITQITNKLRGGIIL